MTLATTNTATPAALSVKGARGKKIYINLSAIPGTDVATVATTNTITIASAATYTATSTGGPVAFCVLDMTNISAHYDLKGTVLPVVAAGSARTCGFLLEGKAAAALTTSALTATATSGATNYDATLNVEVVGLPNDNAACTQTGRTITATSGGTAVAATTPFGYCW